MSLRDPSSLQGQVPQQVYDWLLESWQESQRLAHAVQTPKASPSTSSVVAASSTQPSFNPLTPPSLATALGLTASQSIMEGTHQQRTLLTPLPPIGTVWYETDRTVFYLIVQTTSGLAWNYVSGTMISTFASRPTGLGTPDTGFLLFVTTGTSGVKYMHPFIWTGVAWQFDGDHAGIFVETPFDPGDGYQKCDGTTTTYLSVGADLAENSFTTVDETTASVGTYHTSIAAYTGVVNAPSSSLSFTGTPATLTGTISTPTFSGTPATLTGTVSQPTFSGNAATLTGTVTSVNFNVSGNSFVIAGGTTPALTVFNGTNIVNGSTSVNTPNPNLSMNSYTPSGTVSQPTLSMNSYTPAGSVSQPALTMNSYTPAGTITGTANVQNLGVLRFFRR